MQVLKHRGCLSVSGPKGEALAATHIDMAKLGLDWPRQEDGHVEEARPEPRPIACHD